VSVGPETTASPPPAAKRKPPITVRLVSSPVFWAVLVAALFGLPLVRSMTRKLGTSPPVLGTLPAFSLTDQRGQAFGSRDLTGRVWVADFVFTNCAAVCPLLTERMAEVGRRARKLGPDFHLVTITVDPERDTPDKLAAYGARYGADPLSWSFLTGPLANIEATVVDGFKIGMGKEATDAGLFEIFHGEQLVLVDRSLRVRGYFPATAEGLDRLMEAVGRVVNGA
jgi:protein SCO1/2